MFKYVFKLIASRAVRRKSKTSVMVVLTALSVCSQHVCVLVQMLTHSSLPGHITNNWPLEYQSQPCWPLPDTPKSQAGC